MSDDDVDFGFFAPGDLVVCDGVWACLDSPPWLPSGNRVRFLGWYDGVQTIIEASREFNGVFYVQLLVADGSTTWIRPKALRRVEGKDCA